jgi:hypothetical protein
MAKTIVLIKVQRVRKLEISAEGLFFAVAYNEKGFCAVGELTNCPSGAEANFITEF